MAIDGLFNKDSPYVHSNYYNFRRSMQSFFGTRGTSELHQALDVVADKYIKIAEKLEEYELKIYGAAGVSDFQGLNQKLFGSKASSDYFHIAQEVVRSTAFLRELQPRFNSNQFNETLERLNNLGNSEQFSALLLEPTKDISFSEMADTLYTAIQSAFLNGATKKYIPKAAVEEQLGRDFTKEWKRGVTIDSNHKNSRLYKLVKEAIVSTPHNSLIISLSDFLAIFKKYFLQIAAKRSTIVVGDIPIDQIARDYGESLYNYIFANKNFTDFNNMLGDVGEGILSFAVNDINSHAFNLSIQADTTGANTEAEVAKKLQKILNTSSQAALQMANYSLDNKMENEKSKTDNLITIYNNGVATAVFRIQSKNTIQADLENLDRASGWFTAQMKQIEKGSMAQLFQLLEQNQIMTPAQTGMLAYYIANTVWFNKKGDYQGNKLKRTSNKGTGGLAGAQKAINELITSGIQAFIGITIDDFEKTIPNYNASNIFYFLGARSLFPVSQVLRAAANQIRNEKDQLMSTYFSINMADAQFSIDNVNVFWNKKLSVIKQFPGQPKDYTNPELLNIGGAQGSAIIGSVGGKVNFKFNIEEILRTSSYLV